MSDAAVPQPTRQGSVRERILQLEESIGSPTSAEINRFEASAARAIAHRLSRSPSSDDGLRLALLDLAGSRRSSEAPVTPERFVPSQRVQGLPSLGTVPRASAAHQSPQSTPTTPTSRNKRATPEPRATPPARSRACRLPFGSHELRALPRWACRRRARGACRGCVSVCLPALGRVVSRGWQVPKQCYRMCYLSVERVLLVPRGPGCGQRSLN